MIKTKNVYIDKLTAVTSYERGLSLSNFYNCLKTLNETDAVTDGITQMVVDRIEEMERREGKLTLDTASQFLEAFQLIFGWVNNLAERKAVSWGISTPIPSVLIAGTKSMYSTLECSLQPIIDNSSGLFCKNAIVVDNIMYELVLDRLYGIPMTINPYLYAYVDEKGIKKYVQLTVDFSYVSVQPRAELPKIDFSCVNKHEMLEDANIQPLLDSVHLDNFVFEGFSMLKFTDATVDFVVDSIQEMIADFTQYTRTDFINSLLDKIKSVLDKEDVHCSLFPILYLNGVPILKEGVAKNYLLFNDYIDRDLDNIEEHIFKYLEAPFVLAYNINPDFDTQHPYFVTKIQSLGINSYVCFPLKHQGELVGFLELYTRGDSALTPSVLTRLSPLFPVLTLLGYDLRLRFKNKLETVILQHYTALQPAVQWRFNQAAAKFLKDDENTNELLSLEKITFTDVYPLYGGVDIKDSTLLRNLAFRKDNTRHLDRLVNLMSYLPEGSYPDAAALESFNRKMAKVETWLATDNRVEHMHDITAFFQEEVPTFILTLTWLDAELDRQIKVYAGYLGANHYQEAFETSLQAVNTIISKNIEQLNDFIQSKFPSYFEKFRTDGIEYDFYIGQSISPSLEFNPAILRVFRQQQLISMAHICRQINQAQDTLQVAMETTQLIFVHPKAIDISFRDDEKRFDVEGGYNIRYQMIKKRIDKVLVRGTKERLVQPGKIAVVVQGESEVSILIEDLFSVADQGLIEAHIEELVLEELQGVSGLRALRVNVIS